MTSKLINEIKELKEFVNQSAQNTQRQLQSIDNFLLIGSLISFIFAFWFIYLIDILIYWVPASFLLMFLWTSYSLYTSYKKSRQKSIEDTDEIYRKIGTKQVQLKFGEAFRNLAPLVKAIGIIYVATFFILILKKDIPFPVYIPAISAFLFVVIPFFFDRGVKIFETTAFDFSFQGFWALSKQQLRRTILLLLIMILAFLLFMLVLPVWSFVVTHTLYYPVSEKIWLLLIAIIVQAITIGVVASYISSLSARKELTNTLTNFADIDNQISELLLNKKIRVKTVKSLRKMFLTAKRYDLVVDNTFKFVNFYYLKVNRVYIKNT